MALEGILMTAEEIIDTIAELRAELKLSQRKVAEETGYSHNTIYGWETGKRSFIKQPVLDYLEYLGLELIIRRKIK